MSQPINHTGTDEIVCPWCGFEHSEFWLSQEIPGFRVWDCYQCDHQMNVIIERTYTTTKREPNINREGKNVDTTNAGADRPGMG